MRRSFSILLRPQEADLYGLSHPGSLPSAACWVWPMGGTGRTQSALPGRTVGSSCIPLQKATAPVGQWLSHRQVSLGSGNTTLFIPPLSSQKLGKSSVARPWVPLHPLLLPVTQPRKYFLH